MGYQVRQKESLPVVEKFYQWVDQEYRTNPMPKTVYGMALTYAQNQKSWLMNVFLDGRLELSNNRAERSIRPFAVGRKNWLFCNTPKGASASAAIPLPSMARWGEIGLHLIGRGFVSILRLRMSY